MSYAIEFPDFPAGDMPAIPAGFADRSWRNEICPCFIHEASGIILWIDYSDHAKRESDGTSRFMVQRCTNLLPDAGWQFDGAIIDLFESDDWQTVERSLPNFY